MNKNSSTFDDPRAAIIRIIDRCELGAEIEPADRVALAVALRGWLVGSFPTLDLAFGLKRKRGEKPNWLTTQIATRNLLLRTCTETYFAALPISSRAAAISEAVSRYQTSAWRADQRRESMPPNYVGTLREALYRICATGAEMPKKRQLIDILRPAEVVQSNSPFSLHSTAPMLLHENTKERIDVDAIPEAKCRRKDASGGIPGKTDADRAGSRSVGHARRGSA